MAATTTRSIWRVSGSSGPVTRSSSRSRSRAACRRRPWRFERSWVSHGPPSVPLYGLPGAAGHVTWRTAQRLSGDLDDRELLSAMEAQRQLGEPELGGLDPIRAGLRLGESDPAGFPPGEDIEEAAERSAVRSPQAVEDLNRPERRAGLGEGLDSRCRGPYGPQFPAVAARRSASARRAAAFARLGAVSAWSRASRSSRSRASAAVSLFLDECGDCGWGVTGPDGESPPRFGRSAAGRPRSGGYRSLP